MSLFRLVPSMLTGAFAPRRRSRPLARLAQYAAAALVLSSLSCLNDSPTGGGKQTGSLGVRMQLGQDAVNQHLEVGVWYLRRGEPPKRLLVQDTVPLADGQTEVAFPVNLAACLTDARHIRGVTRGCSLEVKIRLLAVDGTLIEDFL